MMREREDLENRLKFWMRGNKYLIKEQEERWFKKVEDFKR